MNPLKKAVDEVKYRIPRQLLERVFIDGSYAWRSGPKASLDEQIMNLVIRPRVMVDCQLIGGTQAMIPLEGLEQQKPMDWVTVIHIPKDRTDGRTINSVLDVAFYSSSAMTGYANAGAAGMGMLGGSSGYSAVENSAMTSALASVVGSADKIPMVSTSRVQLIAENTIMIKDGVMLAPNSFLRCVLADDDNLSGLQLRSYHAFAKLVEYAVKAYIYNELVILVDTAELRYGQAVAAFKDVFMGYADAEVNYEDYLKNTWEKTAFMNDNESLKRFIKLLIGGQR